MKAPSEMKQEELTNIYEITSKKNDFNNAPQSRESDHSPAEIKKKVNEPQKQQEMRQIPVWQTTWHYRLIQQWQSIFNRRIASFSCFALQVGDAVLFTLVVGFLILCCLAIQNEKSSGKMAQIMMAATIAFGCRNGILNFVFGLSLERALLWHQILAWVTLGLSFNHWFHSRYIVSGYIIQAALMGFIVFSIKPIRKYLWEFFMKMHWILIIFMIVGCIAHGVGVGLAAIGYFVLDVCYRMYTVYQHRHISREMKLEKIGSNITKITLNNKECKYKGGQYFFIMIPKLSYLQWHPFSVFSASFEEEIVIYVKTLGDWTTALYQLAGETGKPTTIKGYLDGPYGFHSISIESDKYKNFLCVSGGIGVTPIISTAKEIIHEMEKGRPVKNLHFIWTGRDSAIVESVIKPDDLKSLLNQKDAQVLQTFYHYSDKGDKKLEDLEKQALNDPAHLVKLDKGRPNFEKYFEVAFNCAKQSGEHLVGVLTCGPQQLIDTVEISAMKWSKDGIRFDVHQEVFDF